MPLATKSDMPFVVQVGRKEELLKLIHDGGLISQLKGCACSSKPNLRHDGPAESVSKLTEVWTQEAAVFSKELFKRIEGE